MKKSLIIFALLGAMYGCQQNEAEQSPMSTEQSALIDDDTDNGAAIMNDVRIPIKLMEQGVRFNEDGTILEAWYKDPDTGEIITSVDGIMSKAPSLDYMLYPNPFHTYFDIAPINAKAFNAKYPGYTSSSYAIFSPSGASVETGNYFILGHIVGDYLPDGVYLVMLQTLENGGLSSVEIQRIVKKSKEE